MNMETDQFKEMFKEEAKEILGDLEESLIDLEKHFDDTELVNNVFRNLHTLKGSGSMFGYDELASFTHEFENIFHHVRRGQLTVTQELVDISLKAADHLKLFLEPSQLNQDVIQEGNRILNAIISFSPESRDHDNTVETDLQSQQAEEIENPVDTDSNQSITYRIRFAPYREILDTGINLSQLLDELNDLGDCQLAAYLNNIPPLEELHEEHCYVYWDILLTTSQGIDTIKDVFIFVEDESDITIDVIDESQTSKDEINYKKLGHILVERGDLSVKEMNEVAISQKRFGELLVDKGLVESEKVDAALLEQKVVRQVREKKMQVETSSSIRVSSERLDAMVDLVGELVIMQSNLQQLSATLKNRDLKRISKTANLLIWELREKSMEIRMASIESCFVKFKRLVRDLSLELGKEVEFFTEGGETELDKTIIDRLNDPLVHIVRNCIDHGIESPEEREAAGKERKGTIQISASHSGAYILIVIKDDGKGIDIQAVRKKAVENGLISNEEQLSEKETLALLFEPGFSTAKIVTNVSGRGVGMDVVRKNIEALRGSIQVESTKGEGTTITLKVPLTLVIIDGLLMKIGDENFIIPLSIVQRVVEVQTNRLSEAASGDIINLKGKPIPYIRLREQFAIPATNYATQQIVIVECDERKVGLVVDKVIGEHQTVIKSLGSVYRNVQGFSGATILGDGNIALIIDAERLIRYTPH